MTTAMLTEQHVLESLSSSPTMHAVRELAAQAPVSVSLTGAALRDLFLGLTPLDFDFVVEGDADALARRVANLVPGGVLGAVSESGAIRYRGSRLGRLAFMPARGLSVDAFLARHSDFTVNTLAFDLHAGAIVDRHGALADIASQIIRSHPSTGVASRPAHFPVRAVRMVLTTPAFTLDADTRADIERHPNLAGADPADLGGEIHAILKSAEYMRGMRLVRELGMLPAVLRSLMPFPVTVTGTTEGASEADVDGAFRLFDVVDGLIAAGQEGPVSRHKSLLRQVILLVLEMRRRGLSASEADSRRFLTTHGDRIEDTFNALSPHYSSPGIHGFRVRVVTIGYCAGMASLLDGSASIEAVIAHCINTWGRHKGLLSALLIGGDWLLHAGRHPAASRDTTRVTDALRCAIAARTSLTLAVT